MATTKQKRNTTLGKVRELWFAAQLVRRLNVPTWFRLVVARNVPFLDAELKGFNDTFPEPDLTPFYQSLQAGEKDAAEKHKDLIEKHTTWEKDITKPLEEKATLELYCVDELPDLHDDVTPLQPGVQQNLRDQALVEALILMVKE